MPTNKDVDPEVYWAVSDDEETWHHMDPDDAVIEHLNSSGEVQAGDVITIYSGEAQVVDIADLIGDVECQLLDAASEHAGDAAEDWLTSLDDDELNNAVSGFLRTWLGARGLLPKFGRIVNIKPHKVTVLDPDSDEWEFVE